VLNCDVQTVFNDNLCIECDACVDIIRWTVSVHRERRRAELRPAHRARDEPTRGPLVSLPLKTGRIMAKDEDVCPHCGLRAERCPTGAWDMQKFLLVMAHAGEVPRPGSSPAPEPMPQAAD
jgi:ferredoxin